MTSVLGVAAPAPALGRARRRATRSAGAGLAAPGCAAFAAAAVEPYTGDVYVILVIGLWLLVRLALEPQTSRVVVPFPVMALAGWAAVSLAWTTATGFTVTGLLQLLTTTWIGCVIGSRLTLPELLALASRAAKLLISLSWLVYLVLPGRGRTVGTYEAGSLEGVFPHRNLLGYFATLAVVTFWASRHLATTRSQRLRETCWVVAALSTLLATQSRTALVVLLAVGSVGLLFAALRRLQPERRLLAAVVTLGALYPLAVLVRDHSSEVLQSLGRDPTLTGRTDIWGSVLVQIRERPWTGYGWNSIWHLGTQPSQELWDRAGFVFYHAHDGYLDVVLQLGLVGLVLTVVILLGGVKRSLALALDATSAWRAWPLCMIATIIFFNSTETVVNSHVGWFCLVLLYVRMLPRRPDTGRADARAAGRLLDERMRF